jgi:hypothetical protein
MKAFVAAAEEANGDHPLASPLPPAPKRTPEVNEAILERATAKIEALSEQFGKMLEDVATRQEVQAVYREARATRKLLDAHLASTSDERKAITVRLDAIMTMMGEILGRLPEKAPPAATETPPPSTEPEHSSGES